MTNICERIADQTTKLFVCEEVGNNLRIRTPFMYPDGDIIDVYAVDKGEQVVLTDFGETVRWLRMQTPATGKRTRKQHQLIQDVCSTCGVEFYRGTLTVRATDDIADALARISQACVRVADIWFTFRIRSVESLTDEVADVLSEEAVQFERGQKFVGRSGRPYTVDFHTFGQSHSSLVQVLTTGSRGASRRIVEHVLSQWYDLSQLRTGKEPLSFVSLFDDTSDVWGDEDFNLLSDFSTIACWSRQDEFLSAIVA